MPVASNVATWAVATDFGWFGASATGGLAWFSGRDRQLRLEWVNRDGKVLGTLGDPAKYGQLALSPDGRRVAVEIEDAEGHFDIWVIDAARNVASRVTTDPGNRREPVWSPDGHAARVHVRRERRPEHPPQGADRIRARRSAAGRGRPDTGRA